MKLDLHVHTIKSKCSLNPIWLLKKLCRKYKILPAVCDHNHLTKLDFAISGEEVATDKGEFLALFIQEEIPKGLNIYEAFDKVKEQDGLICLPHPFDYKRGRSLGKSNILEDKEFIKYIDIVEVFNSRCKNLEPNIKALEYAKKHDLYVSFGSDSHFFWELGNAYLLVDDFDKENPKELLRELKKVKKEIFSYKNVEKNSWKGKRFFGRLGDSKNKDIYSKYLKKVRNILNI
ncbi:PHP domain-containing protein [Methanocaldococcus infernus]